MRLFIRTISATSCLWMVGCADNHDVPSVIEGDTAEAMTALERLAPGQLMPDDYSRLAQAAYMVVRLEQFDDAVSGQMSIMLDGARATNCVDMTGGIEPWLRFCLASVESGQMFLASGPVTIKRYSASIGDKAILMGAHGALLGENLEAPLNVSLVADFYGDWTLRLRPNSKLAVISYGPTIELLSGDSALVDLKNSEMLIAEKRTKG